MLEQFFEQGNIPMLLEEIRMAFEKPDMVKKNLLLKAAYDEIERLQYELCEAESAVWRVPPNTHTVSCELNNFKEPDPFEGPGETYKDAYNHLKEKTSMSEVSKWVKTTEGESMDNKRYVYLAGPIEGCNEDEINNWRHDAMTYYLMNSEDIRGCNPYRVEEKHFKGEPSFAQKIMDKNWYDCQRCDAILAYLPKHINDRRPSIGTLFEIAWFVSMRKPIFIVSEDMNYINHPLVVANTGWIYQDLDEALQATLELLEY